jgi:hypothetical protein
MLGCGRVAFEFRNVLPDIPELGWEAFVVAPLQ